MPVLISFLNATAGFAAAFCGVILSSPLLVACGAVVAASGSILTHVMCRAMNRRLWQVFLGFRAGSITAPKSPLSPASPAGEPAGRTPAQSPNHGSARADRSAAKAAEPQPDRVGESNARCGSDDPRSERAAGRGSPSPGAPAPAALTTAAQQPATLDAQTRAVVLFRAAHKVIIVPGYGMAVAQAQAEVVELAGWLQRRGTEVSYAIHPVAGRMPGHMNVLLAEADVDYDLLKEMDDINPQFAHCDVAVVVGACDVVNPAANTVPDTPISGMPILRVDQAAQVVVCNLDGRPGYSGVRNPLYEDPKTVLLFGDAKASLRKLLVALEA